MKTARPYTMSNRADAVASTKERIATAALELLMERRYDEVTLADIAKGAGVSHQTVLNHFESKEGRRLDEHCTIRRRHRRCDWCRPVARRRLRTDG
jgi:AcrR family transcriptional regulator